MSNLENLKKTMEVAEKTRFLVYDNPKHEDEKIILDCDINTMNIVTIENKTVTTCTCQDIKPCKHMCKISMKYKLDIAFEQKEKKKVVRKSKAKKEEKVIKLKDKA